MTLKIFLANPINGWINTTDEIQVVIGLSLTLAQPAAVGENSVTVNIVQKVGVNYQAAQLKVIDNGLAQTYAVYTLPGLVIEHLVLLPGANLVNSIIGNGAMSTSALIVQGTLEEVLPLL